MNRLIMGMLMVLLLSACAMTKQYAPRANRTNLKEGNALIRVERESQDYGSARSVEVTDNGVKTGSLAQASFITWQRPAGPMDINLAPTFGVVESVEPIHVHVIAGQEYEFVSFWSFGANSFVIKQK